MASHSYGHFISIENSFPITDPPPVLKKHAHALPDLPTAFELDELSRSTDRHGPSLPPTPSGAQTPTDLEMSRPPSPIHESVEVMQTLTNPPINKYRLFSACLMNFGNGLNDAAPGALIPYLEKDYSINYAIVSLIFVTNAIGFISAAPIAAILQTRLGRAKTLSMAQAIITGRSFLNSCHPLSQLEHHYGRHFMGSCLLLLQSFVPYVRESILTFCKATLTVKPAVVGYIMLICRPPFSVVVIAFFFIGLGEASNLAPNNVFCANLANSTTTLGFLHGSYGIGGTIGPLIATSLVVRARPWSTFYYIVLSVAILNLVLAYATFRNYERDTPNTIPLHPTPSNPTGTSSNSLLKQAFRNKTTILGALFIFAYQGAEVSISGWVISFLISYRHSSPAHVGYVTSGFWAGITLGRFALSHPAHRIGEKKAVFFLMLGAAAFQLLVWLVPNVIGEAVAVSIVGLLLGPIYPCATAVFSKLIPKRLQMSSLAAVSALGSSGGAVAPFFTGLLAQEVGTWVLHPICIGLFAGMVGCWVGLPRTARRTE